MDEIKTFEDACKKLGINPEEIKLAYPEQINHHAKALVAHIKLVIIIEALNDGWKPDWTNGEWDKYYPWFTMGGSSGVDFSYVGYDVWDSASCVGSRLALKSRELAKYAGTQFESLYKEYFVLE
ncbi:MAG: hypothetical protein K2P85_00505 [Flavobacteriaceae bacterium]|nr:hypothetical protein [Flavobacteriaceae bacterium]